MLVFPVLPLQSSEVVQFCSCVSVEVVPCYTVQDAQTDADMKMVSKLIESFISEYIMLRLAGGLGAARDSFSPPPLLLVFNILGFLSILWQRLATR